MSSLTFLLTSVWAINGLIAKVLGFAPRHRAIVARFFGADHALALTRLIGFSELAMAAWILSGRERLACAITQAVVIGIMNGLELWRARDLLLFPRLMPAANAVLILCAFWWSRG